MTENTEVVMSEDPGMGIWDLLVKPLEATIGILTVSGRRPVHLMAPNETKLKELIDEFPAPTVPKLVLKGASKKDNKEVEDHRNQEYLKAASEHALLQTYMMLDMGLKNKPEGAEFMDRVKYYKQLPTPVVGILVGGIQMLLLHQIPPENLDEWIMDSQRSQE